MKNLLIADAGSTKIDWTIVSPDGVVEAEVSTHGMNALMSEPEEIVALFSKARQLLGQDESLTAIHFYGAGCATPAICKKVYDAISKVWQSGAVYVESDLLGAARSLLGKNPGIACILGTGSNSCLYDGATISRNVPSLGFILGDEGSGAALGKRLIADAFKGHLPKLIRDRFLTMYKLTLEDILEYTYRRPAANRFLASLVPFLRENLWNPYVYSLIREEFIAFLKRNVAMYPGSHSLPLAFTGSIAFFFKDILVEAADTLGLKVGKVEKNPMQGLIDYHTH